MKQQVWAVAAKWSMDNCQAFYAPAENGCVAFNSNRDFQWRKNFAGGGREDDLEVWSRAEMSEVQTKSSLCL